VKISETLYVGDVVEMRKPHPCGGCQWEVVRVGADIGIVCTSCGRRVLLTRRKFARAARRFVQRGPSFRPSTEETGRA
jgi:hypothetical protein